MSKWISDAYIKRRLQNNRLIQGNCEYKLWEQEVEKTVDAMPSIDIVFCKECRHYAEHNELYINEPTTCVKHSTIGHYVVVNADDFCSYGERREP